MAIKILSRLGKRKHISAPTLLFPKSHEKGLAHQVLEPSSPRPGLKRRPSEFVHFVHNLETIMEQPSEHKSSRPAMQPRPTSNASWWSYSTASTVIENPPDVTFRYYLPHISNSTSDFYTAQDHVAYDMRETNEHAEAEELMATDFELPFIHEDEFNYYPEPSELPYTEDENSTEESLVLGRPLKRTRVVKKKDWEEFWLEKAVLRLLAKLRLRK